METSIVDRIVDEIIVTCINGTMPSDAIEPDACDVRETDNKAIATQIDEDVHEQMDINERLEDLELECEEPIETSVDDKMSHESVDTIAGCDSGEGAEEKEMDMKDRLKALERDCDELVESFLSDEVSPEFASGDYVEAAEGNDSKATAADEVDEEMDIMDQLEGLERNCDELIETFGDDEMPLETIQASTCGDSGAAAEVCGNKGTITQIEEGTHELEALKSDVNLTGDNYIGPTQCSKSDVSPVENQNDKMSSCSSVAKPQSNPENAIKTRVDPLRSRGFATTVYTTKRKICNLFLLQKSSHFTPHHVKCAGFPSQLTDHELIMLFEKCGPVFILNRVRGNTIFVTFTNAEDAERAVELFNYRNVQGHMVRVARYLPLSRLVVKGISAVATRRLLFQRFGSVTHNLRSVEVFNDLLYEGRIRRFCYLNYDSYEEASQAIGRITRLCDDVSVEFANRRLEWTKTPDTLYITNLRTTMTEKELLDLFCVYGKITFLRLVRNFAKVQFERVEDATRAASNVNKSRLGNENVNINSLKMWIKREDRRDRNSHQRFPDMCAQMARPSSFNSDRNLRPSSSDVRHHSSRQFPSDMSEQKSRPTTSDTFDSNSRPASLEKRDRTSQPASSEMRGRKYRKSSADTLFLKNLRPSITAIDLRKLFSVYGEVVTVDKENNSASVQFSKQKNAKRAAQDIDRSSLGDNVQISFVEQMKTSDTLHIYNMCDDMTTKRLRTIFSDYGEVMDVDLHSGIATVGFRCKSNCERAMESVKRSQLGKNVEISFFAKEKH
ncbi:uncharacterized protein LOC119084255 [Bradysia coprophila]|uniref:uncharacterized protein LOC119084255 n=1 Tax=Bradysia coprophila TaxID=38358 RepID=UPI00187DB670|nr:uncharacterized protein LOC119084255 [Bradysia coprophila]